MYLPEERILDILRWTLDELNKGVFNATTINGYKHTYFVIKVSGTRLQKASGLCSIWYILSRDYNLISFPEERAMYKWCEQYIPEYLVGRLYWFHPMESNSEDKAMEGFTMRHEFITSLIEKLESNLNNN